MLHGSCYFILSSHPWSGTYVWRVQSTIKFIVAFFSMRKILKRWLHFSSKFLSLRNCFLVDKRMSSYARILHDFFKFCLVKKYHCIFSIYMKKFLNQLGSDKNINDQWISSMAIFFYGNFLLWQFSSLAIFFFGNVLITF